MTLEQLREKIRNLATQSKNLLANKGDQVWTADEQTQFDNLVDEITRARAQVAALERQREIEADDFFNSAAADAAKRNGGNDDTTLSGIEAMALYMRFGNHVTPEQAVQIRNAMSTTTQTEGGYTVPSEVAAMVIDRLKAFGGMRDVATILTTDSGQALNFPTGDGTADVGAIVGQNTQVGGQDVAFGTIGLNPFYYTSNKIALPLELIQDSAIDVVAYVVNRLATRIARIQNTHFTVGVGTTQPDGIVPRAVVGKIGLTGQTASVIYDDLVDLKHSVNRAYRKNAKFMLNDLSVAVLSKLKDTTGRPIWEPGIQAGAPDSLLGFAVVTNDDMPVMAANAKSIAFGDLSQYHVRDVKNTAVIKRFDDSAFALANQVGFCGWQRSGGNLLDTAAVRLYANSAS